MCIALKVSFWPWLNHKRHLDPSDPHFFQKDTESTRIKTQRPELKTVDEVVGTYKGIVMMSIVVLSHMFDACTNSISTHIVDW